jgi:hypothetical protein
MVCDKRVREREKEKRERERDELSFVSNDSSQIENVPIDLEK